VEKNTLIKLKNAPAVSLNLKYECKSLNYFSLVFIINVLMSDTFSQTIASPSWDTSVLEKLHAVGLICIFNENKTRTRICIYFYATDPIQYINAEYVTA
jgi:hypothetical protein